MRKPNKSEIKEWTERCITSLTEELERGTVRTTRDMISFSMGYLGVGNPWEQVKGMDFVPFEIIEFCME